MLGANDGIVSTASLVVGVAAAEAGCAAVLAGGVADLAAGAMSMAAGEYVSVSSQADTERADTARERRKLADQPDAELAELQDIYVRRGLTPDLARQVAEQMMKHDALEAHLRDELGLSAAMAARPVQAALASAATFAVGASLPLLVAAVAPASAVATSASLATLASLALLGAVSARIGGAPVAKATVARVLLGRAGTVRTRERAAAHDVRAHGLKVQG